MDLDLQQQVQKRLAELPAGVQAAVHSAEVAAKIQEIGKKGKLHLDQMGKLEDEVYLVMLGFADPAEFGDTLAEALGVAPAAAAALATDVVNEIFMPIRASMQEWAEEQVSKQDADLVSEALAAAEPKKSTLPPIEPAPKAGGTAPAPGAAVSNLKDADSILSEKKVMPPAAKADPAKPQPYKADPYREPAE
jgi:hypothetical protein